MTKGNKCMIKKEMTDMKCNYDKIIKMFVLKKRTTI